MKKPIWDVRIPTLFALLLVVGSIWLTRYMLLQRSQTTGQASRDIQPQNVLVTDVSATTFTVTFTTNVPVLAGVKVTGPNLPASVFFQDSNQTDRANHRISIPNLNPSTEYEYSILLDGESFPQDGSYKVTTAPPSEDQLINPVYSNGKVIFSDGTPANDTLVILHNPNSHPISTLTDDQGEYRFNLSLLRSKTSNNNLNFTPDSVFTVMIYNQDLSSQAKVLYENIFDIPPLTLSYNYDFSESVSQIEDSDEDDNSFVIPAPRDTKSALSITYPTEDESTIDDRPNIRGTASPNSIINIALQPSRIDSEITSDSSGRWQFRPSTSLPQGKNTIRVQAIDEQGITRSATREFSIFPAGSQVAQSATPSATISPTISPTNAPTISPTTTPELTPTSVISLAPSPTATPTLVPTTFSTPTPTIPIITTITPTPPGSVSTLIITFSSVILIVAGATLLFILG